MWRTAWLQGPGVERLNAGYVNTMAITFELVNLPKMPKPMPSSSKPPPKKDDDEGGKKHKGKELFKKASKVFKGLGSG
jgi:hypothetical protein